MNKIHRLNTAITTKQYEELRKLAFKNRISIAQILREWIDEKLINYNKKDKK